MYYIITSTVSSYECAPTFVVCSFVRSYLASDNVRVIHRSFVVTKRLIAYVFLAFPAYIVTAWRVRRTSLLIGFPRTLITTRKPIIRLPACNELIVLIKNGFKVYMLSHQVLDFSRIVTAMEKIYSTHF